jgi:multidrug efflux pump subunit AcrB
VDREILVTLDPAKMQAFGVTAPQVNAALRVLNLNAAGGKAEIGGTRQSVRVLGNAQMPMICRRPRFPWRAAW